MAKQTINVQKQKQPVESLVEPIWDQQPGESALWYNRFLRYLAIKGSRKLIYAYREEADETKGKVKRDYIQAPPQWKAASAYWRWEERALGWDRKRLDTERDMEDDIKERVMSQPLAQRYGRVQKLAALHDVLEAEVYKRDPMTGELVNLWSAAPVSVKATVGWEVGEVRKFNADLIMQYRGVLDDIASEMGQRKDYSDIIDVRVWSPEQWAQAAKTRLDELKELTQKFAVRGLLEDHLDVGE